MDGVNKLTNLDQLKPFLNKDGVLEIAVRGKNARFNAFKRFALDNLNNKQANEAANKLLEAINKNNLIADKSMKLANKVARLNQLNVVLNGLNLCATAAGFVIIYKKLNSMSSQIEDVINAVEGVGEQARKIELKKVVQDHANMLDRRKIQRCYSEDEMWKLVADESNVLELLIDATKNQNVINKEELLYSILLMAEMLATSIMYYDEAYYFNNKDIIESTEKWHISHTGWIDNYNVMLKKPFHDYIEDLALLNMGLSTFESDVYYESICDTIKFSKKKIEDNQFILQSLDSRETIKEFYKYVDEEASNMIDELVSNNNFESDIVSAIQEARTQIGV